MVAQDKFESYGSGLTAPIDNAFAVTPHDVNELSDVTRAIYIGNGGDVAIVMVSGDEVTLSNVATGSFLPFRIKQIKATGTTATNIIGAA